MNNIFFTTILISLFLVCCRTNPPHNVKIIEEQDPIVKNMEEKDSIRIITDTIKNVSRKK